MTPSEIESVASVVFGSDNRVHHRKAISEIWKRQMDVILREEGDIALRAFKSLGMVVDSFCYVADALSRAEARIAELERHPTQHDGPHESGNAR